LKTLEASLKPLRGFDPPGLASSAMTALGATIVFASLTLIVKALVAYLKGDR
jgi:hypothetical protein